ncbi:MAG: AMP-binding protein [Anaerolineales bacterium]
MKDNFTYPSEFVWQPSADYIDQAHLTRFIQQYNLSDFSEMLERSTQDVCWFTEAILQYLDIQFYKPYSQVLDLSRGIAWPRWVVGGEMNIVHNLLDKYIGSAVEQRVALISEHESGEIETFTYGQLYHKVNQVANALRSLGLGPGDAVGLFMPMTWEIVVAMLGIAKIGGIILPLFSGYGSGAVAARLADADAKALFTVDAFQRRGKNVNMKSVADHAVEQVPSLKHMIVVDNAGTQVNLVNSRDHWWHDLVENQLEIAETEIVGAEHILMIIYTSGTTGLPKGAVHTHAGFPIKAAQDMAFGTDMHPGQCIYWITDMGWMMGPWLVFGTMILGSTFLIYDGAPDYPNSDRLWEMVERHRITTLGISPTLIRSMMASGRQTFRNHDLSSLKLFASTGEPWNPDPWMWLFEKIGQGKRPIINYSGGTEISGGILMGNPLLPLKPTAFSAPCPGIAADIFDEDGKPVRNQVGELVIKAPWIGMTRGFWGDPDRYEETYWSRWSNTWVQGDFAFVDEDGQWYILGRSDDTIKIAGKRVGPAEIESILIAHPAVVEAAAIGVPDELKGNQVVVLCVLASNYSPSNKLEQELKLVITTSLGKPLKPSQILFVDDLPKTRNAKVMHRMVRAAYLGLDLGDTSSLVNPESLTRIKPAT